MHDIQLRGSTQPARRRKAGGVLFCVRDQNTACTMNALADAVA
jgi:hypothetical protein